MVICFYKDCNQFLMFLNKTKTDVAKLTDIFFSEVTKPMQDLISAKLFVEEIFLKKSCLSQSQRPRFTSNTTKSRVMFSSEHLENIQKTKRKNSKENFKTLPHEAPWYETIIYRYLNEKKRVNVLNKKITIKSIVLKRITPHLGRKNSLLEILIFRHPLTETKTGILGQNKM